MDEKNNRVKISSKITGGNSFQRSSNRQTSQTLKNDEDDDDNDDLSAFQVFRNRRSINHRSYNVVFNEIQDLQRLK
jgi:hypothetical protein